jgi:LPS-assembly protein
MSSRATYTSCPREEGKTPAWQLTADQLDIDYARNEGVAHGAVLRFYGVPILAGPAISFPVTNARKSGVLSPTFAFDNKAGFQAIVPYY